MTTSRTAAIIAVTALIAIPVAAKQPAKPVAVAVSNTLACVRTDTVEVDSPFDVETTPSVVATDGKSSYPAQVIGDRILFVARDVPSRGCRLFWLTPASGSAGSSLSARALTIENGFIRVSVDPKTGAVSSIFDKNLKRELVDTGKQACVLEVLRGDRREGAVLKQTDLVENGPARATIRSEFGYGKSSIVQDVTLYESIPRVDVKFTVDWQETSSMLAANVPTSIAAAEAPLGSGPKASSPRRWADISERGWGITVLSTDDCFPRADGKGFALPLVCKDKPQGLFDVSYAICSHKGSYDPSAAELLSDSLCAPLNASMPQSSARTSSTND